MPTLYVCVYCGSGTGRTPSHRIAAETLGRLLAEAGLGLIYGGGGNGLMGTVARSCLAAGGHVTGIIPDTLVGREGVTPGLSELVVVRTLHERKMLMYERAAGFVALPGGIGTLEELVEQLTWGQIGLHDKPVVIADIDGYWQPLLALMERMRAETYIREGLVPNYTVVPTAEAVIPALEARWSRPTPAERPSLAAATLP